MAIDPKKRNKAFQQQIDACKIHRRELIREWRDSVDYRRGKPFATDSDKDRVSVPLDWALTKDKQSALFSQVPAIRVSHPPETLAPDVLPWVHKFERRINDIAIQAGVESALDECLPDCINAAGIGVVSVARESLLEYVEVPKIDLESMPPMMRLQIMMTGAMPDGSPIPMETVPREADSRYVISRVSPSDFLWPLSFTGSDFDKAPWIGRSGVVSWAMATHLFGLQENQKGKVIGDDKRPEDKLSYDVDRDKISEDVVSFDEIFYRVADYDPMATNFSTIHRLVFVDGITDPVIDEPWAGQKMDEESGQLVGALKYPIRVLTLSYISDDPIPPSDSAMGRAQVDELNKSRTNWMLQRMYSLPVRWANTDRMDPTVLFSLMRGTWQHIIPVQGNGTNVMGELPRTGLQAESFSIDKQIRTDLDNAWGQLGAWGPDIETKAEAQGAQGAYQTRIARERARVGKFLVGITEVLGGIVSIFEPPETFGEGYTPLISRTLSYSILADSTLLLDSNQRLKRALDFVNWTGKSGWVALEPVLKEIASLSGFDPAVVIRPPSPRPPVEPNVSVRMTGLQDLLHPLMLAILMKSGQAPDAQLVEAAKQLLALVVGPPMAPGMEGMPPEMAGMMGGGPPQVPQPAPPADGDAHPQWGAFPRVNQRVIER
ncbi:hypothetical protein HY346_01495 [Candidatus Microgenomates bacterium]|nr:hypothetical protein [Candidatus Microgenomates bacterium]